MARKAIRISADDLACGRGADLRADLVRTLRDLDSGLDEVTPWARRADVLEAGEQPVTLRGWEVDDWCPGVRPWDEYRLEVDDRVVAVEAGGEGDRGA